MAITHADEWRISRRGLLAGTGVAAAAGALRLIGGRALSGSGLRGRAVPALSRDLFAGYIGELFLVGAGQEPIALHLVDVRDLHAAHYRRAGADREQNFALLFRGPSDRQLSQDTYAFAHPWIGGFQLFIVPMRGDAAVARYEAVVSAG